MIYKMLLYLKNSGSNQRKTKTAIIDCCLSLREWSLIMERRGYKTEGGGGSEILPLRKGGGGRKGFSHAEGGRGTDTDLG